MLATFSTACFGYGMTGLLRPLTVYPSHIVFWGSLPSVTVFQGQCPQPRAPLPVNPTAQRSTTTSRTRTCIALGAKSGCSGSRWQAWLCTRSSRRTCKDTRISRWLLANDTRSFPLLNGFSIICLATQTAPTHSRSIISHIFGGANSNEGLGLFGTRVQCFPQCL